MRAAADTIQCPWARKLDWYLKNAPDLGITCLEAECIVAKAQLSSATGFTVNEMDGVSIDGGIGIIVGDRTYWWRNCDLFFVGGSEDLHALPKAHNHISVDRVEEKRWTDPVRAAAPDAYRESKRRWLARYIGHYSGIRKDHWVPIRRAYARCRTYHHVCYGSRQGALYRDEHYESKLVFSLDDVAMFEWRSTRDFPDSEWGYVYADRNGVRYFSTWDCSEVNSFTLRGALLRATRFRPLDRRIVHFLLRIPGALDGGDERMYPVADRDTEESGDTYRLVPNAPGDGFSISSHSGFSIERSSNILVGCDEHLAIPGFNDTARYRCVAEFDADISEYLHPERLTPRKLRNAMADAHSATAESRYSGRAVELGIDGDGIDSICLGEAMSYRFGGLPARIGGQLHGGKAVKVEDTPLWWKSGTLYSVGEGENEYDLPKAPSYVTVSDVLSSVQESIDKQCKLTGPPASNS